MTSGQSTEEEEVLLTNTEDHEEDYDNDGDGDDDDDDEDDSWLSELKSSWKQHLMAVLMALAAATAGFLHLQTPTELVMSLDELLMHRHDHLHRFERMANVTFCTDRLSDAHGLDSSMELLEVKLPTRMVKSLEYHFRADMLQDDNYTNVLTDSGEISNEQFECLKAQSAHQTMATASTWVYQTPTVKEILNDPDALPVYLSFTGFAAKFFNLSPNPILLHWDGQGGTDDASRLVAEIAPMESIGTATTPGQGFYVSPVYDGSHALQRWTVTADEATLVYENTDRIAKWDDQLKLKYDLQQLNLLYARDYLVVAKKTWLAHFPRPPPVHHIWDVRKMGQVHSISSEASHHVSATERASGPLTLTLNTTSVAPRVLEIDNFLSTYECQYLMKLAMAQGLTQSTVVAGSKKATADKNTRSSTNVWIERETDAIVDTIYRRAANVFNIDDSLLRHRSNHHQEHPSHSSMAESLQVVHYARKQEYTPHHDFTYPSITNRYQPSRFATLLLYLNTVKEGGETTFPRSINGNSHEGLVVTPVRGKAVLFYNMLPDGNLDDLSQHGSNAVTKGEKWVANLWVWDPIID
jgi:prolyl 4-hydroxylase